MSISENLKYFVTGSRDKSVKLWSLQENDFTEVFRLRFKKEVLAVEYLEPELVAAGFSDGAIKLIQILENQELKEIETQPLIIFGGKIKKIRRNPDPKIKQFAACSNDQTVRIFTYN